MSFKNSIRLTLLTLVACLVGYGIGVYSNPRYVIQPLPFDQISTRAKLYDGAVIPDRYVGDIEIREFLDSIRAAAWTNDNLMRKGNWIVQLSDHTNICLSYYGDFFWVDGRRGYFVVPDAKQPKYGKFIQERISMPVIEWRHHQTDLGKSYLGNRPDNGGCANAL